MGADPMTPTDWPETPVPCAADPAGWEVPGRLGTYTEAHLRYVYSRIVSAINTCITCPARLPCAELAQKKPPQHHVQAGWVYSAHGRPMHAEKWLSMAHTSRRQYAANLAAGRVPTAPKQLSDPPPHLAEETKP